MIALFLGELLLFLASIISWAITDGDFLDHWHAARFVDTHPYDDETRIAN